MKLFLHDLQDLHGTCLHANTAGNALGCRILRLHDHDLHGASFNTLTTGNAQLLIDHINASFGILGNSTLLAGTHALTTLNTGVRLCTLALGDDLNAAQIRIEFLIESGGASTDTFQTCHTLSILIDRQLLHTKDPLFI